MAHVVLTQSQAQRAAHLERLLVRCLEIYHGGQWRGAYVADSQGNADTDKPILMSSGRDVVQILILADTWARIKVLQLGEYLKDKMPLNVEFVVAYSDDVLLTSNTLLVTL